MKKIAIALFLSIFFSVAANAETHVCTAENYMYTYERKDERFIKETRINFVMPQIIKTYSV